MAGSLLPGALRLLLSPAGSPGHSLTRSPACWGPGMARLILLLCQKIVVRGVDLGWGLRTPKGQPKAWCYGREMTQCTGNGPSLEVL